MRRHRIHYISTLPGTGKTEYAIRRISRIASDSLVLYVGPTLQLLQEVATRLAKVNVPTMMVSSNGKNTDSVVEQLRIILTGEDDFIMESARSAPMTRGVILCSHDCFLRIPQNNDFLNRKDVHLVFDEVRKCVSGSIIIRDVNPKLANRMANLFDVVQVGTEFVEVPIVNTNTQKFWSIFGTSTKTRHAYKALDRLLQEARIISANSVWLRMLPDSNNTINIHVVLMPMKVFYGWKSCLIMAAFFEDSQMYHMLKRDTTHKRRNESIQDYRVRMLLQMNKIELVNITDKAIRKERLDLINKRLERTHITYVFEDFPISKYKLTNYVLVKDFDSERFLELAKPVLGRVTATLGKIAYRLHSHKSKSPAVVRLLNYLSEIGLDTKIVTFMCRVAETANRMWEQKIGYSPKLIPVSVNKDYAADLPEGVDLMPFHSHGLNLYKKNHTIGFFSAVNIKPEIAALMCTLCEDYNPHKDYMLEQAVQSLMRCSVRDVTCDTPVLMVVPDRTLALELKARLHGLPKILELSKLGVVVPKFPIRAYKEKERNYEDKRRALYKSDPTYRRWHQLRKAGNKEAADKLRATYSKMWTAKLRTISAATSRKPSNADLTKKLHSTRTAKRYRSLQVLRSQGRIGKDDPRIDAYRNSVKDIKAYLINHSINQTDAKFYHLVR